MPRSRPYRTARTRPLLSGVALAALLALSAAGCTTHSLGDVTGSIGSGRGLFASRSAEPAEVPRSEADWRREAAISGERYRANTRDVEAAIRHAQALRQTGQRARAVAVLQHASLQNPNDKKLLGAYGRALADAGDLPQALDVLSRAHTPDQPDWRILSAQGAVLDQMGRYAEARRYYETALNMMPDEPSVLSNLGLSYALAKDLAQAETTLRRAAARNATDRRIRQNLALVVGLQGRFPEAEEIARADLPPAEAAANIAYLKQMMAQRDGAPAKDRARRPAPPSSRNPQG